MISGKDVVLTRTSEFWLAGFSADAGGWYPFPWTAVRLPAMLTEAQARRRGLALLGKQERRYLAHEAAGKGQG